MRTQSHARLFGLGVCGLVDGPPRVPCSGKSTALRWPIRALLSRTARLCKRVCRGKTFAGRRQGPRIYFPAAYRKCRATHRLDGFSEGKVTMGGFGSPSQEWAARPVEDALASWNLAHFFRQTI